ncbi:thioesterase [Streptomyces oceani]|uniref:Thioesterase n=2 Tax=Streptomyces oceani TaxID=1075402 RepID=A0A1E7KG88_9ACTN|nr:thioesterase [Streptomyces oceani]
MDAFGHVNNVVFLRYLEEARIDFLFRPSQDVAESPEGGDFKGGSVVARHEIDYLRPLEHRQKPVTIETWVTRIAAASTTLAYEIKDAETVYARANSVIVPYDLEQGRPRRLTSEEKSFLEGYFDDSPSADLR